MKDFKVYQVSGYLTNLVADASDVRKAYEEISGSQVEFYTPISAPLEELIVDINPVQDLNGQDAPYPAGGGDNKIDYDTAYASFKVSENKFSGNSGSIAAVKTFITPNLVGKQLTFSANIDLTETSSPSYYRVVASVNSSSISGNSVTAGNKDYSLVTFTPVSTNDFVQFAWGSGSGDIIISDIQLEIGGSRTTWKPYSNICPITGWTGATVYHSDVDTSNPTVYTVSWQNDAGTVYGGTVDLVSGVLTVDTVKAIADGTQSPQDSDEHFIQFISKFPTAAGYNPTDINLKCNRLKPSGYTDGNNNVIFFSNAVVLFFRVSESVSNWTTYLQNNPVEFSYKIAEPITYQLTPQEINTLIGVNNIWADTGDVSVKYRTH